MTLLHAHVDPRPVRAVIYTHSHIDHFGGVRGGRRRGRCGVRARADPRARGLPRSGHQRERARRQRHVSSRQLHVRRAAARNATGHVDAGLGKGVPLLGTSALLAPTDQIATTGEERVIDGVRIVFQVTPDTEAPAEMNFFFPDAGALCMAENCSANLHNLVHAARRAGPRRARPGVTTSTKRSSCSGARRTRSSCHITGRDRAARTRVEYMRTQRDVYRYLHDQTLRLANHGLTMIEIAEELTLPAALERRVLRPRLLRHGQPQREGDLPALPRLVRRQPGTPASAPADRGRAALRRLHGRSRRSARGALASRSTKVTTGGSPRW